MAMDEPGSGTRALYSKGHEAASGFDYFVCGVAGAMFAYTAEHYSLKKFALDFSLLEPFSLLLLAVSFYCGLRRLHFASFGAQIDHDLADLQTKMTQIGDLLKKTIQEPNGNELDRQKLVMDYRKYASRAEAWEARLPDVNAAAGKYYRVRDIFLMFGFALVFFAKVLQPYQPSFAPPQEPSSPMLTASPPAPRPVTNPDNAPVQATVTFADPPERPPPPSNYQSMIPPPPTSAVNTTAQTLPPPSVPTAANPPKALPENHPAE